MPKNIKETLKKEANIYRGALGLINRIIDQGAEMDPDILNCFQKMKTVAEEIDYLEKRSNTENIPDHNLVQLWKYYDHHYCRLSIRLWNRVHQNSCEYHP